MTRKALIVISVLLIMTYAGIPVSSAEPALWEGVDEGLSVGEFQTHNTSLLRKATLTIIRIDPDLYTFRLVCAKEVGSERMPVKEWCHRFGLLGGVNAGMYQGDLLSNVGYMKNYTHINNARIASKFLSVFACNPVRDTIRRARIFDIDESNMQDIIANYNTIVQNLRLIKRPGENRWQKQSKIWSEVALGEDADGNILFIYSPVPFSMHEFNEILLSLPIDLVCAQHLEGGPEASMYFRHGGVTIEKYGSYAAGLHGADDQGAAPIPNMIGFTR